MFGWFRARKRRKLAQRPFPPDWLPYLDEHVPFYGRMSPELQQRFLEHLKVFAWEKHFIGAGGFEITDEARVVVSAAAVRLVVHLDLSFYDRLTEILIYPSHYKHDTDGDGEGDQVVFGEAHQWGTVVLSWQAVLRGLHNTRDGHDTATHEFAHVLDRGTGAFNGTPELRSSADYRPWARVMSEQFLRMREGERSPLRKYGATNEAEFFAVATETFFEKPDQMLRRAPELYEELSRFYGFDPAED